MPQLGIASLPCDARLEPVYLRGVFSYSPRKLFVSVRLLCEVLAPFFPRPGGRFRLSLLWHFVISALLVVPAVRQQVLPNAL